MTATPKLVAQKIGYDSLIVFDLETAAGLGSIEKLTLDGFLLKSAAALETDKIYRISISLPVLVEGKSVIRFVARSLWCEVVEGLWGADTSKTEYYWTGFEIMALDENDTIIVSQLIDLLAASVD